MEEQAQNAEKMQGQRYGRREQPESLAGPIIAVLGCLAVLVVCVVVYFAAYGVPAPDPDVAASEQNDDDDDSSGYSGRRLLGDGRPERRTRPKFGGLFVPPSLFGLRSESDWQEKEAEISEEGGPKAQWKLYYVYSSPRCPYRDDGAAIGYLETAAAEEFSPALFELGRCYELGKGVSKDLHTALDYYQQAGEAGLTNAKSAIERVEKKLQE